VKKLTNAQILARQHEARANLFEAAKEKTKRGMVKGELTTLRREVQRLSEIIRGMDCTSANVRKEHATDVARWRGRAKLWRRLFYSLVGMPGNQPEDEQASTVGVWRAPDDEVQG
jgi:hypothetical protein